MNNLVIFIGAHKTGSSYIRECLKISDCYYIGKPYTQHKSISFEITDIYTKNSAKLKINTDLLSRSQINVISEERLSSILNLENWNKVHIEDYIYNMVNYFSCNSKNQVKYVLVTREPTEYILSRYSENPALFEKVGLNSFKHLTKSLLNAINNPDHYYYPLLQSFDFNIWKNHLKKFINSRNLLFLNYEDLINDKNMFLEKISSFAGFRLVDCGDKFIRKTTVKQFGYIPKEFNGIFMNYSKKFKVFIPRKLRINIKKNLLMLQAYTDKINKNEDLKKISDSLKNSQGID